MRALYPFSSSHSHLGRGFYRLGDTLGAAPPTLVRPRAFFVLAPFGLLWLLSLTSAAWANLPAAYLACEGAEVGSACTLTGPQYGTCTRDTLCEDPPETPVNECILCVDDCWGRPAGESCLRRWTGEPGVCVPQSDCTDKVETSFQECNRCVVEELEPDQGPLQDRAVAGAGSGSRQSDSCQLSGQRGTGIDLKLLYFLIFSSFFGSKRTPRRRVSSRG